jgi:uncharacterized membrane protein YjjP (DUF1212 family)
MTPDERGDLVLACARTLFVNGQATDQIAAAAERLARALGLRATLTARWGELLLRADGENGALLCHTAANPAGVHMGRVAATMRAMADIEAGRLAPDAAMRAIDAIARMQAAPTWLFALAAAASAAAFAVLYGAAHLVSIVLVAVSAGAGAVLRRSLAEASDNNFIQPFGAAILAGAIGAVAVRSDLSSSLRLVAVCPCMILVPGPHVLNGALDLIGGRINLGAARLLYAGLIVLAISTGLLLGLALLGVTLPVDAPGRVVPLWQDIVAAGVAVTCFCVFFSMPPTMLPWPVAVGMLAHALRWVALAIFGFGVATGALIACVIVGLALAPVSRRADVPFAAVGFASVVSMMPGVYLFRTMSGLVQIADGETTMAVLHGTIAAGVTASTIILAMTLGFLVPKTLVDYVGNRSRPIGIAGATDQVKAGSR